MSKADVLLIETYCFFAALVALVNQCIRAKYIDTQIKFFFSLPYNTLNRPRRD